MKMDFSIEENEESEMKSFLKHHHSGIYVRNLHRGYTGQEVLKSLNMNVKSGTIYGLNNFKKKKKKKRKFYSFV